jgi:hypothetical protein
MSIEIFALSNRRVASFNRWQEQIDVASLHLVLPTQGSIDKLHGFLPVRLEGNASGFECAHCDPNEVAKLYPNIDFGRNWTRAIAFNSQGLEEDLAAYQAAAAYAKATEGIVFDPQEGLVMSPQQAFAAAGQLKANIPKMKEILQAALAKLKKS